MIPRKLAALLLLAIPAAADQRLFDRITATDSVRVVLPGGHCEATVIGRGSDRLALALKETTTACGDRGAIVTVYRSDTYDVAEKSARRIRGPAARMAARSAAVVMVVSSISLGATRSRPLALARIGGAVAAAGAASALANRSRGYIVATERIERQP
jgi:hypothetical protein